MNKDGRTKKVLAITNTYLPNPNAIGVCLENIMHELEICGYEAYVITMAEGEEYLKIGNSNIYNIPPFVPLSNKSLVVRKARTALRILKHYPLSPFENRNYVKKFENTVQRLISQNDFAFVLCVFKPVLSAVMAIRLKALYPDINVVFYELDSITDNDANYVSWTKFLSYRNRKLEKQVYDNVDVIFHQICHKRHYLDKKYQRYSYKSEFTDVPLLDERLFSVCKPEKGCDNVITCVYSGMLYENIRSPEYLLNLMRCMPDDIRVRCDFYSNGCEACFLNQEPAFYKRIYSYGFIEKKQLDEVMKKADVFLNIGNHFTHNVGSIPSKLFYYISFGKPIIHIAYDENDNCIPYLRKYPAALILYEKDDLEENKKKTEFFLQNLPYGEMDFETLRTNFYQNTATYVVEKILKKCESM